MRGPSPTRNGDASASSSSSFTPRSEDEFEIRTVCEASQRQFKRLSSDEVEREFLRLSPEEVAKLTPEERGEYWRQSVFMREMEDLDQDDDTGHAALRARYDNDNRASKRRRMSSPSCDDDISEMAEQLK